MPPRRSGDNRKRESTPLDAKQRELKAKLDKLRADQAEHKRFLEDAPRIKQEEEKRRREELVTRTGSRGRRGGAHSVLDGRVHTFNANVGKRALRSEKKQERLQFAVVALVFVVLLVIAIRMALTVF